MVKLFNDLLSIINLVKSYVEDLIKFILSPKEYLEEIEKENSFETIVRVVVYALMFTSIEYVLISKSGDFNYLKIIKISIFETVVSLSPLPIIYLQLKFLKSSKKLKSAIIYCLSFRFTYLLVPIIFYSLFLFTEAYTFFILNSILSYAYITYLIFRLPIMYPNKIKERILILTISLLSFLVWYISIALLIHTFSMNKERAGEHSPLFDSVRHEVQKNMMEGYDWNLDIWFDKFIASNREIIGHFSVRREGEEPRSKQEDDFYQYRKGLKKESDFLLKEYSTRKRIVEKWLNKVEFNTTKDFIELKIADINSRIIFLKYIGTDQIIPVAELSKSIDYYDASEKWFIERLAIYIENTNILRDCMLLTY